VEREVNFAANLLRLVRQDLADVQSVCDGSKKQTNDTRDLLNNLSKGTKQRRFLVSNYYIPFIYLGITPPTWKKYRVPPRISAMQWMSDFVARLKQLDKLATLSTNEGTQSLRVCRQINE
jgi:dynein heavy chain 1